MIQNKSHINVGIVGCGFSATTFHIPFLQELPSYTIKKIVSHRQPNATLDGIKFTPNLDEVVQDPEIDLVIIATPSHLHFDPAKSALEHKKHVVVEKPFVLQESQAQALILLAKDQNKLLTVYHNRRWDSDFLTVKQLIDSQTLGDVFYFEVRYDRFRPQVKARWKEDEIPGAGTVWDLGSHLLDQAIQLFGQPQKVISDIALQRLDAKAPDYFQIILIYESGLRVILGSSSLFLAPVPKFQIHGTKGSFIKYGADPQEQTLFKTKEFASKDKSWGQESPDIYGKLSVLENDQIVSRIIPSLPGQYQQFYEILATSLLSGSLHPPVNPQDVLYTTRMLQILTEKDVPIP